MFPPKLILLPIAFLFIDLLLVKITFDNNFLTGTLPIPSLGSTLYLNSLSVSGNQLSGSLPVLLESTNLHALNLAKNAFRGTIPDSWSAFTELGDINLYQLDQVTGTIPSSLFHSLSNLHSLRLGRTKLSGDLSNVLDEFPSLGKCLTVRIAPKNIIFLSHHDL
jgi:hypothetical protein